MYAIVEIEGHQYKVQENQQLFVNRLPGKEGDKMTFDKVLLTDKDGKVDVGAPTVKGTQIDAKILQHLKGDKVQIFKKKRRKGYQKLNGHRQSLSQIEITGIGKSSGSKSSTAKKETAKSSDKTTAKASTPKKGGPKAEAKTSAQPQKEPAKKGASQKNPAPKSAGAKEESAPKKGAPEKSMAKKAETKDKPTKQSAANKRTPKTDNKKSDKNEDKS